MFQVQKEITGHTGAVYCCCVNNEFIYSGGADHYVTRWNIETGEQDKFAIKFDFAVYALEVCNDFLIVGLSNGNLHVFNLIERKEVKFFTQHQKAIFSIRYNSAKNQLYVTDAEGNLTVWNTLDFSLMIYLPIDCGKIRNIAISQYGDMFVLACQDGTIRIVETNFFNEIQTFDAHTNGATAVIFHPLDSTLLISGGKDALIKVWEWKNEKLLETIVAHNYAIYTLIGLKDGFNFVSASRDKSIKVWDSSKSSFLEKLDSKRGGHRHSVNAMSKINEGSFVTCSDDGRILIWNSINE